MRALWSDVFLCLGWGVALWGVLHLGGPIGEWGNICGVCPTGISPKSENSCLISGSWESYRSRGKEADN